MTEPTNPLYKPPLASDLNWSDYLAPAADGNYVPKPPQNWTPVEWALGAWLSALLHEPVEIHDEFYAAITAWFNELENRMDTRKLISRLREQAATHDAGWSLYRSAADEIERLLTAQERAELEKEKPKAHIQD